MPDGTPEYLFGISALTELGVPAFASIPDLCGEIMAAAIERRDVSRWASEPYFIAIWVCWVCQRWPWRRAMVSV